MTTSQIVILVTLVLVILLGYVKTMLSKNDNEKYSWGILQIFQVEIPQTPFVYLQC
jgi:hypothetical protein